MRTFQTAFLIVYDQGGITEVMPIPKIDEAIALGWMDTYPDDIVMALEGWVEGDAW